MCPYEKAMWHIVDYQAGQDECSGCFFKFGGGSRRI